MAKFVRAYELGDIDTLVALLTNDVCVSMPPVPLESQGRADVARFYASINQQGRIYDLVPTRANGQPAFGTYLRPVGGVQLTKYFPERTVVSPASTGRPSDRLILRRPGGFGVLGTKVAACGARLTRERSGVPGL